MESRCKILVCGDIMIDRYFYGNANRISPEAPVPVLLVLKQNDIIGGAGNVANNLIGNNVETDIACVIGNDNDGKTVKKLLTQAGIGTDLVFEDNNRITTVKTRFLAQNNQQILRVDSEKNELIRKDLEDEILLCLSKNIKKYKIIILSDYLKGFLSARLCTKIIKLANDNGIKVVIDVKDKNYNKYKNAFLLKPNLNELIYLTGEKCDNDTSIENAARKLCLDANVEYVLVTRGADGMMLVSKNNVFAIKAKAKQVYDVTGAGDTAIAFLSLCLMDDLSVEQSVNFANIASGIKVSKVGACVVTKDEVNKEIKNENSQKFLCFDELNTINRKDKKLIFTNGCFDVIHAGHVKTLVKAKELGDILVVGINSDESIKRLKGEKRPINNLHDRIEVLNSISAVDYVCVFEEDTPIELIKILKPDVLVKGSDYKKEEVVGYSFLNSYGGKVELIDLVDGLSSTNTINKLQENGK